MNTVYERAFAGRLPTRTTVGASLPGYGVEIDCIAVIPTCRDAVTRADSRHVRCALGFVGPFNARQICASPRNTVATRISGTDAAATAWERPPTPRTPGQSITHTERRFVTDGPQRGR